MLFLVGRTNVSNVYVFPRVDPPMVVIVFVLSSSTKVVVLNDCPTYFSYLISHLDSFSTDKDHIFDTFCITEINIDPLSISLTKTSPPLYFIVNLFNSNPTDCRFPLTVSPSTYKLRCSVLPLVPNSMCSVSIINI